MTMNPLGETNGHLLVPFLVFVDSTCNVNQQSHYKNIIMIKLL